MKALAMAGLLAAAMAAGFAGSMIQNRVTEAEPVEAQRNTDRGIRIALVNLEECARQSRKFAELKDRWEASQGSVKTRKEKLEGERQRIRKKIQNARLAGRSKDEMLELKVELKTIEESIKAADKEDQAYLSALLQLYQKKVLEVVLDAVTDYAKTKHFDIVLQDYSVDSGEAAFFEGSAFAQAVLSTPVVYAPGLEDNSNGFVTDITDAIIQRIK